MGVTLCVHGMGIPPYPDTVCDIQSGLSRFALLHGLHSTPSSPASAPPAATGVMWSAVRSVLGWGGRLQPGHQSPLMVRCAATTARRRTVSRLVPRRVCRGQREPELRVPHSRQGRLAIHATGVDHESPSSTRIRGLRIVPRVKERHPCRMR